MSDDTQPVYQCLHNPLNRYITHNDLRKILQKANVLEDISTPIEEFDLKNFQKAFTHISYTVHRDRKQGKNVIEKEDVNRLSVKPRLNELLEKVTNFLDNYPDPPKILSKNTRSKRVNLAANI